MTISTQQKCRYELHFANMWEKAKIISSNIKTWINDDAPEIEFKEPCLPRGRTSVQDQDLESYYRVKFFYMGMDEVIGELTYRFQGRDNDIVCALGEICLGENATVEQFDAIANYYNLHNKIVCAFSYLCKCRRESFRISQHYGKLIRNILFVQASLFTLLFIEPSITRGC